jgi:predicted nucleic acid-binding protein
MNVLIDTNVILDLLLNRLPSKLSETKKEKNDRKRKAEFHQGFKAA